MLLGCIADDFTGASDLANTLVKGGMATVQFVGVPSTPAGEDCEAGVVALKTRSGPAAEAVQKSLAALEWLKRQGCRQFVFKYCSTFDSTPAGNIGPVATALRKALKAGAVVICPGFPATGRTVYMGHLFVSDSLLNRSGMEKHPLNPMIEPDIRRWLAQQTSDGVGFIPLNEVRAGPRSIEVALRREEERGRPLAVLDAVDDSDLLTTGEALREARFITGGSGIASGLPRNFDRAGLLSRRKPQVGNVRGPGVVLSGSCSTATQEQVEFYRASHPSMKLEPVAIASGRQSVDDALAFCEQNVAHDPMVFSTAHADDVARAHVELGSWKASAALEAFLGKLAQRLEASGVRRFVVAGGETSGAVVEALGVKSMAVGPEIDPGVPLLIAHREARLGLALKSGNFGRSDFFETALRQLEGL